MLNKKSALLTASLLAGLGAAFFRIFIINRYFVTGENRFAAGAVGWNNAVIVGLLVLAALFAVISFRIKENGPAVFPESKGIKASMLVMTGFIALSYPLALVCFGKAALSPSDNTMLALPVLGEIAVYLPLTALIPSVIFFAACLAKSDRSSASFKVLSVFPAVWSALYVLHSYFDLSYAFRDANRLLCDIAFLAVALRFLMESRYYVRYPAPRAFLALSCAAVMTGTAYALPSVVMTIAGVIPFTTSFCYEIALPAILVYLFLGSAKWAREENADELPKGEKKPDGDADASETDPGEAQETEKPAETPAENTSDTNDN
ncbi:MAG: hypothetical protein J5940_02480 [Clostridia bacterium]|nr:hypothetical protein [Clostridia bacterium]